MEPPRHAVPVSNAEKKRYAAAKSRFVHKHNFHEIILQSDPVDLLVAFHEAGHAVVAYWLGMRFDYVTIGRLGDTQGHIAMRYTFSGRTGTLSTLHAPCEYIKRTIIILYAGGSSTHRFPRVPRKLGAASDLREIAKLASSLSMGRKERRALLRSLEREADNLVSEAPLEIGILALVIKLLAGKRTITYRSAVAIIRQAWREVFPNETGRHEIGTSARKPRRRIAS